MKLFIIASIITMSLLSASTTVFASEDKHRHHDAHEHGVGQLNLAIENNDIFIELESPAANIIDFEHKAQNSQQQQTIEQAIKTLHDGNKVFAFNGAECHMTDSEVETDLTKMDKHDGDHEESHADFDVSYQFNCNNAAALTSIEVKLFDLFSGTEELQVKMVTPHGQNAVELSHKNSILEF